MTRIGLTGATGFLGSHLAYRLVGDGHEVVALRRPSSSTTAVDGLGLRWIIGDVTDPETVARLVDGCDGIVHAAAVVGEWPDAAKDHERVNVEGTRAIVAACRSASVQRLVHVSSVVTVPPASDGATLDEGASPQIDSRSGSYRRSKHLAEEIVLEAVRDGLDAVIVNPSWLQGPSANGFHSAALIESVRRRRVFVPYFHGGTNFVHVEDVVAGIVGALEHGHAGERYILAGENHSWRSVAETTARELGLRRVFLPVPRWATASAASVSEALFVATGRRSRFTRTLHFESVRFRYYSSSKATREFGYQFRPYRDIVREYLDLEASSA